MKRVFGLVALVALFGAVGYIPGADDPPPAAGKGPVSPPGLEVVETGGKYLVKVQITNIPEKAVVNAFWSITPAASEIEDVDCENACVVGGPPGDYILTCQGTINGKKFKKISKKITLTGGGPTPVPPGPGPGPVPVPPGPTPGPVGKVAKFIVVEDTAAAKQWRGDILGSRKVVSWYNQAGMKHRLISTQAAGPDGGLDPEAQKFVDAAKGKTLPYLFMLDAAGTVVKDIPAPIQSAEAFLAAFGASDTEAGFARAKGNLPPPKGKKYAWKKFGASPNVPLIPRSDWKEVDLSPYLPDVKDQDGVGACNAFAAVTALEGGRAQAGLPYVKLSPGYLYGNINGGTDQGSMLEDGMAWLIEHGTCASSVVGDLEWRKGRQRPQAARDQEKYFRVVEAYICPSFDAIASALQQGFFIVEGLMWYDDFAPDRDGWITSGRRGGGGHALCGYGTAQRNGNWGVRTRNSWSTQWGVNGNCVLAEPLFGREIGGYWAVRSVVQSVSPPKGIEEARRMFDLGWTLAP